MTCFPWQCLWRQDFICSVLALIFLCLVQPSCPNQTPKIHLSLNFLTEKPMPTAPYFYWMGREDNLQTQQFLLILKWFVNLFTTLLPSPSQPLPWNATVSPLQVGEFDATRRRCRWSRRLLGHTRVETQTWRSQSGWGRKLLRVKGSKRLRNPCPIWSSTLSARRHSAPT